MCTALTIQGRLSRGCQGYPQFLANQLTLFQPRGAYHSHHISNGTSKFFDLPLCLQSTYQHSVIPLLVFLDDTLVSASWWSFFLSRIFLFLIFYLRARVFSGKNNTISPSKQKQLHMIKETVFSVYNRIVQHIHLRWSVKKWYFVTIIVLTYCEKKLF